MKRIAAASVVLVAWACVQGAQARSFPAGRALLHAAPMAATDAASCPAGAPVQTITVVNQAAIKQLPLARFENAMVAQSMQLRAAWGTPCVQFASSGWPLYITSAANPYDVHYGPGDTGLGSFQDNTACSHRPDPSLPCALASVAGHWTTDASHELVEMLVDPSAQGDEICDPVEQWSYEMDGVWVSDWIKPDGRPFA